ncbi:hypothetical protein TI39_contig311g00027 [Zymoseptoria brevis]|uniref:Arrestin-like N-terminal domain-containing protein n=1 Tax=Zymoseptoria brevis TaxID=1047168 RepID=A0A0F4GTQ3_9PEZI|nr:hypothetical protein TI39_contig311g00027 [Zymoseptoria brevis]
MADAKLGSLAAKVVLDRGMRPHYGPADAVTGNVILSYMPYKSLFKYSVATADLFGPLKLEATLRGKIKISVKRDREFATDCGAPLFRQAFEIFDGSFKAEVGQKYEFPFTINFPDTVNGVALPPSFSLYFSDYPDKVDCAISYRVGCKFHMPGIDIKTSYADWNYSEPIVRLDYHRPPPSVFSTPVATFHHKSVIQHSNLLPEAERPSGFRAKTKAAFKSNNYPTFACRISCTGLRYIYPGFTPEFVITLRRSDLETTATFIPDISLVSVKAHLIADTIVDTSGRLLASCTCSDSMTAQKQVWKADPDHPVFLSKANDYTATVQTDKILGHTSTFSHILVARSYHLRVNVSLKIAEQRVDFSRIFPVVMLPRPSDAVPYDYEQTVEAGPSQTDRDENEDADLPAYHEIEAAPPAVTKNVDG